MKISINLLPPETIAEERQKSRFYKIQFIGIAVILIMVFLASLTLALQVLQSRNISVARAQLSEEEQKVVNLKSTQASLLLLKNRLTVINQYLGVSSKSSALYRLIDKLVPPSVVVNSINIDKGGDMTLSALVADSVSLDDLLDSLVSKDDKENKISQVSIQSLGRGRDGQYRISFKIGLK
ncbi:hypothetical protein HYU95_01685 [Candidatus Daviesbacteria bacterium]|nr:hypothetical protein [Candidatus Daviesbacteria bacterium]